MLTVHCAKSVKLAVWQRYGDFLDSNEVSRITFLKKPSAELLPLEKANPDELKLKNLGGTRHHFQKTKDNIFLHPAKPEEPKKKRKR
jgi:hypothetical protein